MPKPVRPMPRFLIAVLFVCAACTPKNFPDNPFEANEANLTAPAVQPITSGFPDADDLAAAREAEAEAFGLTEEAEALSERVTDLAERDPTVSDDLVAPAEAAEVLIDREDSLRDRAETLRGRTDVGQPQDVETLETRRLRVDEEAETLRTRAD